MNADIELIEHIKKRYKIKKDREESTSPHGDERFQHILAMGEASAFKEILMLLDVDV